MYKIVIIMIVLGVINATCGVFQNQVGKLGFEKEEGIGYLAFGSGKVDMKEFNLRMRRGGFPEFSQDFIFFGGGDQGIFNKIILEGEGYGFLGEDTAKGNYKTSLSGGYGFINLGYIVRSEKNFRFYPMFGLGLGNMKLKIIEKGEVPFDDVLKNPKRASLLSNWSFLLNFCLGGDYIKKIMEDMDLVFGLRIGYTGSPIKGEWSLMDEIDTSSSPKIGITGPYIRLMIGFSENNKISSK